MTEKIDIRTAEAPRRKGFELEGAETETFVPRPEITCSAEASDGTPSGAQDAVEKGAAEAQKENNEAYEAAKKAVEDRKNADLESINGKIMEFVNNFAEMVQKCAHDLGKCQLHARLGEHGMLVIDGEFPKKYIQEVAYPHSSNGPKSVMLSGVTQKDIESLASFAAFQEVVAQHNLLEEEDEANWIQKQRDNNFGSRTNIFGKALAFVQNAWDRTRQRFFKRTVKQFTTNISFSSTREGGLQFSIHLCITKTKKRIRSTQSYKKEREEVEQEHTESGT